MGSLVWALAGLSCSPAESEKPVSGESISKRSTIERASAEAAPDFELALLGTEHRVQLEALRGQTVVLDFWAT
ncbi:peroxiredoxin family protein, partial [Myxococcota bacterium]|nr:peroxiredoxin family protein [Myxococcota bacterium]